MNEKAGMMTTAQTNNKNYVVYEIYVKSFCDSDGDGMGGLPETLEEALGSTVVVEYESGGDGGAFEVGTAPAGSAELERLIAAARSEADELARIGGWAAVRIGFGGVETIDCETGRTVYAAGAE